MRCSAAPLSLSAAVTSGRAADRGARKSRVLLSDHSAIIESGAYMLYTVRPVAAQEDLGVAFATAVGCTGTNPQIADCLRNASVAALLAAQGNLNTSPTTGTTILPQGWRTRSAVAVSTACQ